MKQKLFYLLLSVAVWYGCTDQLELPDNQPVETRASVTKETGEFYYYANGEKHYLDLNPEYVFVASSSEESLAPVKLFRNIKVNDIREDRSATAIAGTGDVKQYWTEVKISPDTRTTHSQTLSQLRNTTKDLIVSPYFKTSTAEKIGLSNYFYVKLKKEEDISKLRQFATENQVKVIGQNQYMPLWYVLSITPQSDKNALEMANHFYESGAFQYAEPDFMEDNLESFYPNDALFGQQWGVTSSSLPNAWNESQGEGIRIAILDQGILKTHPDLQDNIDPYSYDTETATIPSRLLGAHGTSCAGVAAARGNNGIGITGVAPKAKLMDISSTLYLNIQTQLKQATGIMVAFQAGADIISNSWFTETQNTMITEAIMTATTYGRNGKGCVVIYASGNHEASRVAYPSSLPQVICVGAIGRDNRRASFSNYGENLSVMAPGVEILSTTYDGDYRNVNGTSFACPYVAGVAALVLSANPNLSAIRVKDIIEKTARKLTGYVYEINKPNGLWNNQMGYGIIDPYAAVQGANSSITGPSLLWANVTGAYKVIGMNENDMSWSTTGHSGLMTMSPTGNLTILNHEGTVRLNSTVTVKAEKPDENLYLHKEVQIIQRYIDGYFKHSDGRQEELKGNNASIIYDQPYEIRVKPNDRHIFYLTHPDKNLHGGNVRWTTNYISGYYSYIYYYDNPPRAEFSVLNGDYRIEFEVEYSLPGLGSTKKMITVRPK